LISRIPYATRIGDLETVARAKQAYESARHRSAVEVGRAIMARISAQTSDTVEQELRKARAAGQPPLDSHAMLLRRRTVTKALLAALPECQRMAVARAQGSEATGFRPFETDERQQIFLQDLMPAFTELVRMESCNAEQVAEAQAIGLQRRGNKVGCQCAVISMRDLRPLSIKRLRALADAVAVDSSGNKPALLARLAAYSRAAAGCMQPAPPPGAEAAFEAALEGDAQEGSGEGEEEPAASTTGLEVGTFFAAEALRARQLEAEQAAEGGGCCGGGGGNGGSGGGGAEKAEDAQPDAKPAPSAGSKRRRTAAGDESQAAAERQAITTALAAPADEGQAALDAALQAAEDYRHVPRSLSVAARMRVAHLYTQDRRFLNLPADTLHEVCSYSKHDAADTPLRFGHAAALALHAAMQKDHEAFFAASPPPQGPEGPDGLGDAEQDGQEPRAEEASSPSKALTAGMAPEAQAKVLSDKLYRTILAALTTPCPCKAKGNGCHWGTCTCCQDCCTNRSMADPSCSLVDREGELYRRMVHILLQAPERRQSLFLPEGLVGRTWREVRKAMLEDDEDDEAGAAASGSSDSEDGGADCLSDEQVLLLAAGGALLPEELEAMRRMAADAEAEGDCDLGPEEIKMIAEALGEDSSDDELNEGDEDDEDEDDEGEEEANDDEDGNEGDDDEDEDDDELDAQLEGAMDREGADADIADEEVQGFIGGRKTIGKKMLDGRNAALFTVFEEGDDDHAGPSHAAQPPRKKAKLVDQAQS
jgi:hypothetical protein